MDDGKPAHRTVTPAGFVEEHRGRNQRASHTISGNVREGIEDMSGTASRNRPMEVITASVLVMTVGAILMEAGKSQPQLDDAYHLVRIGHAMAGTCMALLMGALIVLNGSVSGMTVQEKVPTYMMRAISLVGMVVGIVLVAHAIRPSIPIL